MLLNLGSPESTNVSDVRDYLREFLMDERVIDKPWISRWVIVNLFILPSRPKNSAAAYKRIWKNGSPLILTCKALQERMADMLSIPAELGMRYGKPSTKEAIRALANKGVDEAYVIPLYPHYAMSSYETAVARTRELRNEIATEMNLTFMPPFYSESEYIESLYQVSKPSLDGGYDHILFSYHGIPERHLRVTDPTDKHCLQCENCCDVDSPAHASCYRHQCLTTTRLFARHAGLRDEQFSVSFQSRLGREPWLKPYTDHVLKDLPGKGVKRLLVMCPAFVADNLETLEEIAMEGRSIFMDAGGESFDLIPCLNIHKSWVKFLNNKVNQWMEAM